jgi:site-specific recombinase XerD
MNQLALLPPEPAELTIEADAERTRRYIDASRAEATRKAYRSDFRIFTDWCRSRGLSSIPAAPQTIADFLTWEADAGRAVATIQRRCAAIAFAHKLAGYRNPPTKDATVEEAMKGIRRRLGTAPNRKAPATHEILGQMLHFCPANLRGTRDRALLTLGFAGAFRRSELVALNVADLTEHPDGFRVMIRQSKGDQESAGQEIAIPRGYRLRPCEVVQAWLTAADISSGPVFRPMLGSKRVLPIPLQPKAVLAIVKRYAKRAGLDLSRYSAHSLRAGFITSAAESGASIFKMMEVSRHKSVDTLRGYVRSAELFKEHAGSAFL